MPLYYARRIYTEEGMLMAVIADEEAMNRAGIDEERGTRIIVSSEFYGSTLVDEKEAVNLMMEADILVLTGSRIIEKAISMGLVHPDSVIEVKGLRHVQVFKFSY